MVGTRKLETRKRLLLRGLEAAVMAAAGAFLARLFIAVLLHAVGDSPIACLTLAGVFFLWPGPIDLLRLSFQQSPLFTAPVLLGLATVVGGGVGLMDGLRRIHPWSGRGLLNFVLDVTWGLPGSTNGCLLHFLNIGWGEHDVTPRTGAHRYHRGFSLKRRYAFTLGSVLSNLPVGSGDLVDHERIHVFQNRVFGPLFTLTYLGWMLILLIPAVLVGALRGKLFQTIEGWCYANNPWEAWAYAYGGWRPPEQVWRTSVVVVASALYFLVLLLGGCFLMANTGSHP